MVEIYPPEFVSDDSKIKLLTYNNVGEPEFKDHSLFRCNKCWSVVKMEDNGKNGQRMDICPNCEQRSCFTEITPQIPKLFENLIDLNSFKVFMPDAVKVEADFNFDPVCDMCNFVRDRLVLRDEKELLIYVLWIISTWKLEWFNHVPYLQFVGPVESGKTKSLDLLSLLGHLPVEAISISPPAIPRLIEKYKCELLMDQAETSLSKKTERGQILYSILLSGYKKGQKYVCADKENPDNLIIKDVFGFKALATERIFSDALNSRSIIFRMKEAKPGETSILDDGSVELIKEIRAQLIWYRFNVDKPSFNDKERELLKEMGGRLAEIYEPLLTVAKSVGYPIDEIVEFAKQKQREFKEDQRSTRSADILQVIKTYTESIEEEEKVWLREIENTLADKELTASKIGWILRSLNIKTKRGREGTYVDLMNEKNLKELDGLFKKYGLND